MFHEANRPKNTTAVHDLLEKMKVGDHLKLRVRDWERIKGYRLANYLHAQVRHSSLKGRRYRYITERKTVYYITRIY